MNAGEFLTRKVGPLPTYGYAIIAAGATLAFVYMRKRNGGTTTAATASVPPLSDGSGGGIGGGGSTYPVPIPPGTTAPAPVAPGDPMPVDPFAGLIHIDFANPLYYFDAAGNRIFGGNGTPTPFGFWDSRGVWNQTSGPVTSPPGAGGNGSTPGWGTIDNGTAAAACIASGGYWTVPGALGNGGGGYCSPTPLGGGTVTAGSVQDARRGGNTG